MYVWDNVWLICFKILMSPVPLILNTHKQPCKQGSFYTQAALQTRQLLHTKSRSIKAAFTHKKPFKQGSFYRQEAFQTRQFLHTSSLSNKTAFTHKQPVKQGSLYTQAATIPSGSGDEGLAPDLFFLRLHPRGLLHVPTRSGFDQWNRDVSYIQKLSWMDQWKWIWRMNNWD